MWPKLVALVVLAAVWQVVVWSGWRPESVLPAPATVLARLSREVTSGGLLESVLITMRRAAIGFSAATVIGLTLGIVVARVSVLRVAVGGLIAGLETMPSIVWFPLAILAFGVSETAIASVVILGAAPAIAHGVLSGVDQTSPLLVKAGRTLGARGMTLYRLIILPAALPSIVSSLKLGWAFAWRGLMAGELIVAASGATSVGSRLQLARQSQDAELLVALMIAICLIGIVVDVVLFGTAERAIRRRYGLVTPTG